jgi:hypothetical protein
MAVVVKVNDCKNRSIVQDASGCRNNRYDLLYGFDICQIKLLGIEKELSTR